MDTETAYQQLRIRYYRWALEDFEREINEDYPYLQTIAERGVQSWIVLFEGLDNEQKRPLSRVLVKRAFRKFIANTEDPFTAQDAALLKQYERVLPMVPPKTPDPGKGDVKKIKIRRLASRIIERLSPILGDQLTHFSEMEWLYVTLIGDWNVKTVVLVNNPREPQVRYWQSAIRRDHVAPLQPGESTPSYSFVYSLGLGPTYWFVDYGYELEPTADSLATLCTRFIDAFPRLVDGLSLND